ncbi:MAG TPA: MBL fold metallo-hydrolase [Spirochaetota bacterium]|nr:MBL fold metallo-hydrolase [Spirochaetota bacterium]HPF07257.1 MBL fold metallo-hydrolase [Spirochaetota bacterium]HPR37482.1 MBL fold metallo-hydrolase [Spirochaetota bacterium]HRX47875.1 MBL fold metallo-hydrolase [Spirochaetota bacterium]
MEEIKWLGHSGFKIKGRGKVLYIDPFEIKCTDTADFIFITHSHKTHFSVNDIKKISAEKTNIYATPDCIEQLDWFPGWTISVEPGGVYQAGIFTVTAVPAYSIKDERHRRELGWVGYVIDFGDMRIYHAGDTELIPEIKDIRKLDYAFLPVSGAGVMNAADAAAASAILRPVLSIPMHYGHKTGSLQDAESFKEKCPGAVRIIKKD